jgi:hypothetical protein
MVEKKMELNLKISLEEANLILKALGNLPFSQVYELIGKINEQANEQLKKEKKEF